MADRPLLEIAANSLASALAAQEGGADRIELCGALEVGGLTPSHGLIALVRERVKIPIYVLIRPRAGDFVYVETEFETMLRDIEACVALGCDGVVIGALDVEGGVDSRNCRELIRVAGKLGVTFHRAIDVSRDPLEALEAIIALGCERVLTSGGRANALDGVATIRAMAARGGNRLRVMAGAGVTSGNVARLRIASGAAEFHASARTQLPSRSRLDTDPALGMSGGEMRTDVREVRALVAAFDDAVAI